MNLWELRHVIWDRGWQAKGCRKKNNSTPLSKSRINTFNLDRQCFQRATAWDMEHCKITQIYHKGPCLPGWVMKEHHSGLELRTTWLANLIAWLEGISMLSDRVIHLLWVDWWFCLRLTIWPIVTFAWRVDIAYWESKWPWWRKHSNALVLQEQKRWTTENGNH